MDRPKVRFADDTIVNGQEQVWRLPFQISDVQVFQPTICIYYRVATYVKSGPTVHSIIIYLITPCFSFCKDEGSSPLLVSPGVLRILLENRQARSFQYLPDTTAGDVVAALCDKLGFKDPHLFSLVLAPSHGEEPAQKGKCYYWYWYIQDYRNVVITFPESKSRKSSARSSNTDEPQVVSSSSPDSLLVAPWDCISKVKIKMITDNKFAFLPTKFKMKSKQLYRHKCKLWFADCLKNMDFRTLQLAVLYKMY